MGVKYTSVLIGAGATAAGAVLAFAGGVGGLAAAGLFAVVAGYLVVRRPAPRSGDFGPERFFSDAGEETALPDLRQPPANDSRIDPPAREHRPHR
jgi:hypothetical protein